MEPQKLLKKPGAVAHTCNHCKCKMGSGQKRTSGRPGLQATQPGLAAETPGQQETLTQAKGAKLVKNSTMGCPLTSICMLCCAHALNPHPKPSTPTPTTQAHKVNQRTVLLPRCSGVQPHHYDTLPFSPVMENTPIPSLSFCLQNSDSYASSATPTCKEMELLIGIAFLTEGNQSMVFGGSMVFGLKAHVEAVPAPRCHFLAVGAQDVPSVLKMWYGGEKPLL